MDELVKIAEKFYAQLYNSNARPENIPYRTDLGNTEVPAITKYEIKKALKGMSRGKAADEDGITVDLLKNGCDIVLEKLGNLYTECHSTLKVAVSWQNASIILIHKKGDVKEIKKDRPISLLSVV